MKTLVRVSGLVLVLVLMIAGPLLQEYRYYQAAVAACAGYTGRTQDRCWYRSKVDPTIVYEVNVSIAQEKLAAILHSDEELQRARNAYWGAAHE